MGRGFGGKCRGSGLVCFLLWLSTGPLAAQVAATASFDRPVVEAGDTFTLRVLVAGSQVEPRRVDFTPWYAAGFSPENVLGRSAWSRSGPRWMQQFTLILFDSAALRLPPLRVHTHLGDSVSTNSLNLMVRTTPVPADVQAAAPLRDILREPSHWTDYWLEALSVLLVLALLTWVFRRKKPALPPPVQPAAPPLPATPLHEVVLTQIQDLQQKNYCARQQYIAFYAELSLIVRGYLEQRFRIAALESTTREILSAPSSAALPGPQLDTLRTLLREADLAKYADHIPPPQACENALAAARRFVLSTHTAPVPQQV